MNIVIITKEDKGKVIAFGLTKLGAPVQQVSIKKSDNIAITDQHRHIATILYGKLRGKGYRQFGGVLMSQPKRSCIYMWKEAVSLSQERKAREQFERWEHEERKKAK